MDPDANLTEQRKLVASLNAMVDRCTDDGQLQPGDRTAFEGDAQRLAELVAALDEWIVGGGFLPSAWRQPDTQLSEFLDDAFEYFDNKQDVNDGQPNKEMGLAHTAELLRERYDPTQEPH